ncbi:hypothetical protein [Amycolatopsis thermophila]|uniref:Superfamily II DNA or RNA helicase n=1 Tax=Amycolatopsis thermophila TaxID=206084 RepID=A0ABU0F1J8_9PSEU|nr:hypothetical protein [Amycolatopsis thermophila]MDQ0381451.1 superfamily II DNA or RNA helicase [Amycolatopsis thermophila]
MTGSPLAPGAVASTLFDSTLRASQHQAVRALDSGRGTLVVLPTGSDKVMSCS